MQLPAWSDELCLTLSSHDADDLPGGIEHLTQLECLWAVTKLPLQLPASLAPNLQVGGGGVGTLVVNARAHACILIICVPQGELNIAAK